MALKRTLCVLAGVLSISAASPKRSPRETFLTPDATIRRLLNSPDPREQAWGAWIAGRDLRKDAVADVEQVALRNAQAASPQEEAALDAALDALIQLNQPVSLELVLGIYDRRSTHALILASYWNTLSGVTLLEMLDHASGERWYVVANLLVFNRPPGAARAFLDRLTIDLNVTVTQAGETELLGFCGLGNSGLGHAPDSDAAADFPPVATYSLTRTAVSGSVVVSDYPVPVYYVRSTDSPIVGSSWVLVATRDDEQPDTDSLLTYLTALAFLDKPPMPLRSRERRVIWRGREALDADVARFHEEARRGYADILERLVAAEALTAEEARQVSPRIRISVTNGEGTPVQYNPRPALTR